ncbi:QWRF motif-containing protein 2 [Sesamum alatum]|uniref:QWRF motif-containing protein 2 n=1 Tax=Sesamum alatum TaxID=300844 RepID=A0AAE1YPU4_9LAMI|nr:QWRF motif-containing protein 2 [Sesamum alatum]
MVIAVASKPKQLSSQKRPPLLRSDTDNASPRRPKAREVTSRYLSFSISSSSNSSSSTNTTSSSVTSGSSIYSRRSQSPVLSSRASIATPKDAVKERAVSAERRRPAAVAAATKFSAERVQMTSMRSLLVSFQGESFSLPVNKVKPSPTSVGTPGGLRKGTPERRKAGVTPVRDQTEKDRENSRPSDQLHRWPGRSRGQSSSFFTRNMDYSSERGNLNGSMTELNELRITTADENSGNEVGVGMKVENNSFELDTRSNVADHLNSDSESVSSESTASGSANQLRGGPRGITVPARFWQEVNSRALKVPDPASPASDNASSREGFPKLTGTKKFQNDSPVSSPRELFPYKGLSSPLREGAKVASPSKALNSSTGALLRGMPSPTRTRNGLSNLMNANNTCSTPSMLSFAADVRRGKLGENRIVDAHNLRLLHNRQLQWRLANARAENALLLQKQAAERSLYNAWVSTSKLRHSVKSKRIELQMLRHNLKLYSILKEQELNLVNWDLIDRDHWNSLSGAIKALEASTIRLPVVGGARADVQKVQEAISSAVDVMQAMASSVCSLATKVEQTNLLLSELSNLSAREHRLLDEFKDLLSTTFIPLQHHAKDGGRRKYSCLCRDGLRVLHLQDLQKAAPEYIFWKVGDLAF